MNHRASQPRVIRLVTGLLSILFAVFYGYSGIAAEIRPADVPPPSGPALNVPLPDPYWPANDEFPGQGKPQRTNGFRNNNYVRRHLFAERRALDQNALVFVGDSITQRWKTLEEDFASLGVKIANRGVDGDTTVNLLYRLEDDVLILHPRALVILIGTNDLKVGNNPADAVANIQEIVTRIRQRYPDIPIALCRVLPRGPENNFPEKVRQLNSLLDEMAASARHVTLCDTYGVFAQPDGSSLPEDFKDRLHLNAVGYAKFHAVLAPVLAGWKLSGVQ
jgi:lysophospholipase L1-like esterase